jgi:hypothetical protein
VIRPLERRDLAEVARLFQLVMRQGEPLHEVERVGFFERTLLDHPWADPEIPSLVHVEDEGRIAGFLGSHVRRLRFDGRPVRVGYVGHLMAAPGSRPRGMVGTLLLRRYLAGPQDASLTDTAGEPTRRMWEGLGGRPLPVRAIGWTRVFRPWQLAADRLRRPRPRAARLFARASPLLDRASARTARALLSTSAPATASAPLTGQALVREVPKLLRGMRLRLAYEEPFVNWLFAELERLGPGRRCVRRLVSDGEGAALGWYVYLLSPGGVSHVLELAAPDANIEPVLEDLLHHARVSGSAALHGRLEPSLPQALSGKRAPLAYRGGALAHCGRRDLLDALDAPDSLLTRMDGEWWSSPPD